MVFIPFRELAPNRLRGWNRVRFAHRRSAELTTIINTEGLIPDETATFVDKAFRYGSIQSSGTAITKILPPVSRFTAGGGHGEKK